jgi:hypothetical protein
MPRTPPKPLLDAIGWSWIAVGAIAIAIVGAAIDAVLGGF